MDEPVPSPLHRGWWPSVVAGAVALISAAIAWAFTCDDAAITFRFAEQAAAGNPLGTVVPGDPLVSGFSNPTWTVILTNTARLGLPVTGTAKVLGALCFALTAVLATRLIGRLVRRAPLAWVGAAVGASCTVATWSVSGLENPLVGLLVVATALLLVAEEQDERTGWRGLGSSAVVAVLVISRPDTFTYLAAAGVARGLATRRSAPSLRVIAVDLARWAALPLAVLLGWSLFSIQRFGYPMANTVYAKVHVTVVERLVRLTDLGAGPLQQTVQFGLVTATLLLVPLAIVGCWRRGTPATTVAVLTAATFVLPFSEADWMADFRFYAVSVPLLVVLAAVGLDAISDWYARREPKPATTSSSLRLVTPMRFGIALIVLWSLVNVSLTAQRARDDFANQVTVSAVRTSTLPLAHAGTRWGVRDPLVMTADAGATVDDLDLRILDMAGLLDPQISHLMDDPAGQREYAFAERRPELVRAGTSAWNWNKMWGLTPSAMEAMGYLRLTGAGEQRYIRRDLVVRPATGDAPSAGAVHLDELLVPAASTGGPIVVRAWVSASASARTTKVRITVTAAGSSDAAVSTTQSLGSGVVAPDEWTEDEAVLQIVHLVPPAGSHGLQVRVDAIDADGRSTTLGETRIAAGAAAVAVAADRLGSKDVDADPAATISLLQQLDDLTVAAPAQADAIAVQSEQVRATGLDQLRRQLADDLAAGRPASEMEGARRAIAPIRGRAAPTSGWRSLAARFQDQAKASPAEERYRLLVVAAAADPTSASIQKDLLAARSARPSRQFAVAPS